MKDLKVSPLVILGLALVCATILAALGKIPVDTIDKILLLVVGGALGSLAPQAATQATQATQQAIVRAVGASMSPPTLAALVNLTKPAADPPKDP